MKDLIKAIDYITLKRKRENVISRFPTFEQSERKREAQEFIEKTNKDMSSRFEFVRTRLNKLRKEFQNEFQGKLTDADYFIFNSIKWE